MLDSIDSRLINILDQNENKHLIIFFLLLHLIIAVYLLCIYFTILSTKMSWEGQG